MSLDQRRERKARRTGRRIRRMGHSYLRGARMRQHWLHRITALGWWTLAFALGFGFFGLDTNRSLAYQLFAAIAGILLIGLTTSFWFRPKVVASRLLPRMIEARKIATYSVMVTNRGKRALSGVRLLDMAQPFAPDIEEFVTTTEPGEENRNGFDRVFRYYRWAWLAERRLVREDCWSEPFDLLPGESINVVMAFRALRRGRAVFSNLKVTRLSSFGIFRGLGHVEVPTDKVMVMPSRVEVSPEMMGSGARYQLGGDSPHQSLGQSDEFHGLRDYRSGDPLQHVHWKSWARTGKPIIRQFENTFFPRYGLIVDSHLPDFGKGSARPLSETFERAMTLASSLAARYDARETFLDVLVTGQQVVQVTSGPGHADTRHVIEVLSGLQLSEGDAKNGESTLRAKVRQQGKSLSGCWVLLMDWGGWRSDLISDLQALGVEARVLVLRTKGFDLTEEPDETLVHVRVIDESQVATALINWQQPRRSGVVAV